MAKEFYNICIIDDHQLIRDGIKLILGNSLYSLKSEFGDMDSFFSHIKSFNETWDLLLLDITLPSANGLNEIQKIKSFFPNLPILILTMHDETQFGMRSMTYGADGYITKDNASNDLINAIEHILSGKKYLSPEFSRLIALNSFGDNVLPSHHQLSSQEFNVFLGLAKVIPQLKYCFNYRLVLKLLVPIDLEF